VTIRQENAAVAAALRTWLKGHNLRRVCRLSGIPKSTLYAWMEEERQVPAWAPARLYLALPELRHLAATLGLSDLGLALVVRPTADASTDVRDTCLRLMMEVGATARSVKRALSDAELSNDERSEIDAAAEAVQRVAEELRQLVRREPVPTLKAVKR
jgi:hypothetical protein